MEVLMITIVVIIIILLLMVILIFKSSTTKNINVDIAITFPSKNYPFLVLRKNLGKTKTSLWKVEGWKIKGNRLSGIEFTITQTSLLKEDGKEWMQVEMKGELIDFYR